MTATTSGFVAPGFETVAAAFENAFVGSPTMGAALAVRVDGLPVVDLWGGMADERDGRPWEEDTASVIFSCTKGLVSILAARLVQDGRLDYDAPVSRYWPDFAQAGKQEVTVRHLLAHQSGLSAPREDLSVRDILDWDVVTSTLARQEPLWSPGDGYAYHAITHGWLAGNVIRRITGMSVGEYFAELIARPLKADAWIGIPEALRSRVAHQQVGESLAALVADQAETRAPDRIDWLDRAMTLGGALTPELVTDAGGFNDPRLQSAEIPGAGGIATARALAAIWSATVTETDGVRLLAPEVVALATAVQTEGVPVFDVPPPYPRWGMGFQLDAEARRYVTSRGFGHDGAGGQVAFAEPDLKVGFAFTTNLMEALDPRGTAIVDALREVLVS